ncbi:MAG: sulfite exporter TauE/SafE family protein [Calditrichia bacterium]
MEIWQVFMLFGIGAIAGMINVMAGGGSTLTLPALIFLGLDGATANGTNRIAIFIQNIAAILSFRGENVHQFRTSFKLAVWTLPGAIIGAMAAVRISDEWFQKILGIVLIFVVISMMFSPSGKKGDLLSEAQLKKRTWFVYPSLFMVGFYGGFIQVGIGFILMAILFHLMRLDLLLVNMHKVFIVLVYTLPALLIFIWNGNVDWALGLSLAAGNSFGAWWAAKLSVKKGDRFIRYFLFVAVLFMAGKLLELY